MQTPKTTPKDFFLYFGAMITLYWSAGSLIALLFAIINTVIRDNLDYYVDPYSSGIRFAIASLVVIFPISLVLFTTLKRDALKQPEKFLLPLRKWLYAFTMFITSVALIGDIIALLNSFLGGELSTRFLLKAVSVLLVAGIVFWFSLLEVKVKPDQPVGVRKPFLIGTALLVLATIVYGFVVMGSPTTIRKMRFDERRIQDLSTIQWQIVNYWQLKEKFPKSLSDLEDSISGYRNPVDPQTGTPYELILGEGRTFKLCATFEQGSLSSGNTTVKVPAPMIQNETWEHGAGRVCFERVIDPELYPTKLRTP